MSGTEQCLKDYSLSKMRPMLGVLKTAMVEQDFDYFLVITGPERVGKSTLALNIAVVFDPKFDVKSQVCFDIEQLYRAIYSTEPGGVIVADEGATLGMSRDAMTKQNKEFVKLMSVCGERRLLVIVNTPRWDLVDVYLRDHRVSGACKVVSRGKFKFYSRKLLKKLRWDNKNKQWVWPQAAVVDRFGAVTGKVWEDYALFKSEYLKGRNEGWLDGEYGDTEKWFKTSEVAKKLKVARSTVINQYNKGGLWGEKNPAGEIRISEEEIKHVKKHGWRKEPQPQKEGMGSEILA